MAFPAALAAMAGGSALKAGIGGLQNLAGQKEEEERARRNALQQLSQRVQSSNRGMQFGPAPEIPEAPGVMESVAIPAIQAGVGGAVQGALDPKDKDEEWYKAAARGFFGAK